MTIDEILDNIYPLPETSRLKLKEQITAVDFPKGHVLVRADRVEPVIYFLKKGIARAYKVMNDEEVTFWFGREGDAVVSMKSYVEHKKGYENISLLEDCSFFSLETTYLQQLYKVDIHIANWGRRFIETELIKTEQRLIALQFLSATERYRELLNEHPDLVQRVPLRHIASYLGITQVSLSRIRGDIRQ